MATSAMAQECCCCDTTNCSNLESEASAEAAAVIKKRSAKIAVQTYWLSTASFNFWASISSIIASQKIAVLAKLMWVKVSTG